MNERTSITKQIFFAALETEADAREEFLRRRCGDDDALRQEVEALLDAHADSGEFLEQPAYAPARERIGLAVGDTVGPYRLLRVLGEGGMGVVWLAEQSAPMRREVALKVVKPGMDTRRVVARFEAERQTLALMSHDGIARVYDAGSTERGYPYFVMEYVEGVSITDYAAAQGLGLRERLELFVKVCDAVRHAHQKGVLHRDLKPSNVLVRESGGRAVVKIIDFGVAKSLVGGEQEGLTQSGTVIGTPEYMSPEQADQAEGEIDTRSDLYSLGVVLFELVTGELPIDVHTSDGLTEVRRRITQEPPRLASSIKRELRGDLDQILARCLAKRPDERYASVAELGGDLTRHLNHQPILAGPASRRVELCKFVRRHRGLVSGAALVVLALALGLAVSLWQGARARRAEADLLSLSDQMWLERCVREARGLPYAVLADAAALRELEPEFARLASHLPAFRERLQRIRLQALPVEGGWTFGARELEWQHELLERIVDGLTALESADPAVSARAAARLRAERAERSASESVERYAAVWSAAAEAIESDERYGGLLLPPQVGLVPLEPDPRSGLWEFWHPATGERPERDATGRWIIEGENGLVFVLLPAGEFLMGARPPVAGDTPGDPNVDPDFVTGEGPVHAVTLAEPFFLSKYELTQGQWLRLEFENPSQYQRSLDEEFPHDERHPLEQVTRDEARAALARVGLELPTEAQWEYAARAGSGVAYFCGWNPICLEGKANVRDKSTLDTNMGASAGVRPVRWDDGFPTHAPVGLFDPNDFGLHDVHGNVFEWVLEPFVDYEGHGTEPLNGARQGREASSGVLARGGSFYSMLVACRVTARSSAPLEAKAGEIGVRPARAVRW